MKRSIKKLTSLIMALAMVMSLVVVAHAAGVAPTNLTDSKSIFTATDITGAPVELAEATVNYSYDSSSGAMTVDSVSVAGWSGVIPTNYSTLTLSKSGETDVVFTLTMDSTATALNADFSDGVFTLNGTAETAGNNQQTQGGNNQQSSTPTYVGSGTITKNEVYPNGVTLKTVTTSDPDLNGKKVTITWGTSAFTGTTDAGSDYSVDVSGADVNTVFGEHGGDGTFVVKKNTDTAATIVLTFATPNGTNPVSNKDIEVTLAVVADGSITALGGSGSATGTVTNEGPIPANVIDVVVPTQNASANVFNMYLDPHELLKKSAGARYASAANASVTLTGDKRVYFKNADDSFSNESNSLDITNKSNVKVSASLSVEAQKGGASFNFVDSDSAVTSTTNAAAIYLALKVGDTTEAVSNTVSPTKTDTYIGTVSKNIDTGDWYDLTWNSTSSAYNYTKKSSNTDDTYNKISFKLTAAINDNTAWDSITTFPLSVVWNIAAAQAEQPVAPNATVKTKWSGAGSNLVLTLNFGTLTSAKANAVFLCSNENITATVASTASSKEMTVTAPTVAFQYNNLSNYRVVFYDESATESNAVTVTFTDSDVKPATT